MQLIEARNLPRHVGIIMDGNGRWAELRGEKRSAGHRAGSLAVRRTVRLCRRLGIDALTLYAFSFQNWERPDDEIEALMDLLGEFLIDERNELMDNGIRLTAIGQLERLPGPVRAVLDELTAASAENDEMTLVLALSYGGQEEIAAAVRDLAAAAVSGEIAPDQIDVETIKQRLPSQRVGDPDLIIRTGGETRLSNFLLYGSAYAELVFSAQLWPEFAADDLFAAIGSFQQRQRRFGRV
jgi:undecaprenyl diphosphate synthase